VITLAFLDRWSAMNERAVAMLTEIRASDRREMELHRDLPKHRAASAWRIQCSESLRTFWGAARCTKSPNVALNLAPRLLHRVGL
jgi:hypothetical protein